MNDTNKKNSLEALESLNNAKNCQNRAVVNAIPLRHQIEVDKVDLRAKGSHHEIQDNLSESKSFAGLYIN